MMRTKILLATAAMAALVVSAGAAQAGGAALVTDVGATWGYDNGANMTDVFGAGNFSQYDFSANAGTLFSGANSFVMLEGGDSSTSELNTFISANSGTISGWVNSGGRLLIESATNQGLNVSGIGPGTLLNPGDPNGGFNSSGTLTGLGLADFTFTPTPTNQGGNYLAHDVVSGPGLDVYMTGDGTGTPIVAGAAVGAGYVMYSGLTASEFHNAGNGLTDDVIAFTANGAVGGAVPEPATWAMMLVGFGGLGALIRRRRAAVAVAAA